MINFFKLFASSFALVGEVIVKNFRRDFYRWLLLILAANLLTAIIVASIIYIIEATVASSFSFSLDVLKEYTIRQDFYYFTIQIGMIFNSIIGLIIYRNSERNEASFKVNIFSKKVINKIGQALLLAIAFLIFRIAVIYLIGSSPYTSVSSYFTYLSDDSNLELIGFYTQFLITVVSTIALLFFVFRIFDLEEKSVKDSLTKAKIPALLVAIVLSYFFFSTLGYVREIILPFSQLLAFKLGSIGLLFSFLINLFLVAVSTIFIALSLSIPFALTVDSKPLQFLAPSTAKSDDLLDST